MPYAIVVVMQSRRVLLVDQDPEVRLAVDRQLETLGWDVFVVNNAAEAIRVLEMGVPVDAIVLERSLPDMSAEAVVSSVGRLAPTAGIVFMSVSKPLQSMGCPLLVKPFSTGCLARALTRACGYPR